MYVLSTGCQWRFIPKDGTLARIHHARYMECREQIGLEASPTACIIDSQSVKSADLGRQERTKGGCVDPNGYDTGKKIKGKKRHILVDTEGLLPHAVVHPADVQDRDGTALVLSALFGLYPFLENCSPMRDTRGRNSRAGQR